MNKPKRWGESETLNYIDEKFESYAYTTSYQEEEWYKVHEMDAWVADLARRVLERVNVPHIGRYDVLGYELITDLEALAKGGGGRWRQ